MGNTCTLFQPETAPYTLLCAWIDRTEQLLFPELEIDVAHKLARIPLWAVPDNVHLLQLEVLRHYEIAAGTSARFIYSTEPDGPWLELNARVNIAELFRRHSEFLISFVIAQ